MEVSEAGSIKLSRMEQAAKPNLPIEVTEEYGKLMEESLLQPANPAYPMVIPVGVDSKVNDSRFWQFTNAV